MEANFFRKEIVFLRERESLLKTKVSELLELVVRLTSQIRTEGDIYRRNFFAGRRQVNRLKQKLNELNGSAREKGD
jgi:hypothetical protein